MRLSLKTKLGVFFAVVTVVGISLTSLVLVDSLHSQGRMEAIVDQNQTKVRQIAVVTSEELQERSKRTFADSTFFYVQPLRPASEAQT